MATFVSGLYERAKAMCFLISILRIAPTPFGLSSIHGFYDKIGRNPGAITYYQLIIANKTQERRPRGVGEQLSHANRFPAREDDEASIGRVVVLTKGPIPTSFRSSAFRRGRVRAGAGDQEFGRAQAELCCDQNRLVRGQTAPTSPRPSNPSQTWRTCG